MPVAATRFFASTSPSRNDRANSMTQPEERKQREPGGPYFGRLLIVLFLAVAFCAVLTWILSTTLQV